MNNLYFIFLVMPVILLNILADKKNNKKILFLSIIILSVIIGMRGINVGIDTKDYYYAFVNNFPRNWQFEEHGFRFISIFLMKIFKNPTAVILIYSFISNLLIMFRLWDFREKGDFSLSSTLYILVFMFSSMNVMRQFLAISIIFYFSRYLEKGNYLLYIVSVVLASLIHKTALLTIFIPIFYMWNGLTKNKKIIAFFPLLIATSFIIYYVFKYESDHIVNYLSPEKAINNINITYIYRVLIFCISYILYKMKINFIFKSKSKNTQYISITKEDGRTLNIIAIVYFIGLCFSSLGMFYSFVGRIGFYFLIYEPVYWGVISKVSYNKSLKKSMILIYALYVFIIEIILNGSGVFPYYWNI